MAGTETTYSLTLRIAKTSGGRTHAVESSAIDLKNVAEVEELIERLLTAVRALPNGAALNHNWTARDGLN
jgi:hypothetical protein